jgi:hypothetical protein
MTTFSADRDQFSKKKIHNPGRNIYVCHINVNQSTKWPVCSPTTSSHQSRRQLVVEHVLSRNLQSDQPSSFNTLETGRSAGRRRSPSRPSLVFTFPLSVIWLICGRRLAPGIIMNLIISTPLRDKANPPRLLSRGWLISARRCVTSALLIGMKALVCIGIRRYNSKIGWIYFFRYRERSETLPALLTASQTMTTPPASRLTVPVTCRVRPEHVDRKTGELV